MDRLGDATPKGKRYFEDLLDVDADLSALALRILAVNAAGDKVVGASGMYWDEVNDRLGTTSTPAEALDIHKDQNGATEIQVKNISSTAAGVAAIKAVTNANMRIELKAFSAGFTSSGLNQASSGTISALGLSAGLSVGNANGLVRFFAGGLDSSANVHLYIDATGKVSIGNAVGGGRFQVTGRANEKQLIIKEYSTQTENPVEVQNSGGTVLTQIEPDGVVKAAGYKSSDGSAGWTGTFTNGDAATVTVKNGLITGVA